MRKACRTMEGEMTADDGVRILLLLHDPLIDEPVVDLAAGLTPFVLGRGAKSTDLG